MGAPKQKWTAEEEAALKAGVLKHGTGKWRTILSDPEFSDVLRLRSNVDLKDKWRNINATAIWGSRQKAKLALKRGQLTAKPGDSPTISRPLPRSDFLRPELLPRPDNEIVDAKPIAVSGTPQSNDSKKPSDDSKKPIARLDNLILEAITSLKELGGSERASIASYIEDQYLAPSNLKKLLGTKLKLMVENGSLTKINHKYRIPRGLTISEGRKSLPILLEGRQKGSPRILKEFKILTKAKVDADLSKMRSMTAEEAAAAAARAVAEAEVAIAEAEAAAREAEAAEAEAEAAEIFAKAAEKALKSRMVMA